MKKSPFLRVEHDVDFCVVGGGMTGLCAALAAARRGAKTVLIQDRPVLGGNASSEVGVHVLGADRGGHLPHLRETGVLEELRLRNHERNPQASLEMWSLVLYDAARTQPNLEVLYNCTVLDAEMAEQRIQSVTGWQMTTQTWHEVRARLFADCSGDAVLAPLTESPFRMGRESEAEFGESIAPEQADDKTMGMSYCYFAREHDRAMPFKAFSWTRKFSKCDDLPWGAGDHADLIYSPWWCELGGEDHSIHDTERLRDRLFEITFGIWDHIKNLSCEHRERATNRALEQVKFIPGKRESRRYEGDYMLCQGDIESQRKFPDEVAYGGWTMDDHHPAGFEAAARGFPCTIHHAAPSPYGIPLRCFYGKHVPNLMFGGRIGSFTHAALSSTRVMGTCSSMGQAIGTAAALAVRRQIEPHGLQAHLEELQQMLLADDAYLPGVGQEISTLTSEAELSASTGNPEPVRDGINRQVGDDPHCWVAAPGDVITYRFKKAIQLDSVFLVLDSAMETNIALKGPGMMGPFPKVMPKVFRIEIERNGEWEIAVRMEDNRQRHHSLKISAAGVSGVRFTLEETWGGTESRVYAFQINPAFSKFSSLP